MDSIETIIKTAILAEHHHAPDDVPITRPKEEYGDYSSPVSIGLSKTLKQEATNVAQVLAKRISADDHEHFVKSATVAGQGFINIMMSDTWYEAQLEQQMAPSPMLKGKKYIIEYSSPNIAKPMHVGHLRTTILGQVLVNLFRLVGGEVVAWSHPGDWGVQFGKLLVAWRKWGDEKALEEHPIGELLRVYVQFHQEEKNDPAIEGQGKAAFNALQQGDPELHHLWQHFTDLSMQEFNQMYALLGVSFDVWRGESAYNNKLHALVQKALKSGVAIKSDGAIIIPLDQPGVPPVLIQKSDGATLYATADLVTAEERVVEYHPDEMIYVVGNEQTLHLTQVFAAAEKLAKAGAYGPNFTLPKLTHVSYGFFRLTTGKMSTRQGELIRLDEVINQAILEAETMLKTKSPDLADNERAELAKNIGIAAVKYTDLQHDRHTDVVFDWSKMFALEGNSIVYLLYTNARCNSLLREAAKVEDTGGETEEWTSHEKQLLKTLLELEVSVHKSVTNYDPHHLLDHVFHVASDFSRFYNSDSILKAPGPVRTRRLKLVERTRSQLKLLFDLLGVEAPQKL